MRSCEWVFVSLTKKGLLLCKKLNDALGVDAQIFTIEKRKQEFTQTKDKFSDIIDFVFENSKTIVFVMATGIVVRAIKDKIISKTKDPAILVLDENGDFVISLLSGHIGGANEKARLIEKTIGAKAVITTASDVSGKWAVDEIAKKLGCSIDNMTKAKDVTAMIVNGDRVMIDTDQNNFGLIYDTADNIEKYDGAVIVGEEYFDDELSNVVRLIPKDIIIGMGCKRETDYKKIIGIIDEKLKSLKLEYKDVLAIASIDVKADEIGLIKACDKIGCEFITYSANKISEIEQKFSGSSFVKKTVGVSSVSEPCGYLASDFGKEISDLEKRDGITISIWKKV